MTQVPPRTARAATPLVAAYRRVGDAYQRLATAGLLDDDVAAACLEDLYAALELLEDADPSLRAKATTE